MGPILGCRCVIFLFASSIFSSCIQSAIYQKDASGSTRWTVHKGMCFWDLVDAAFGIDILYLYIPDLQQPRVRLDVKQFLRPEISKLVQ